MDRAIEKSCSSDDFVMPDEQSLDSQGYSFSNLMETTQGNDSSIQEEIFFLNNVPVGLGISTDQGQILDMNDHMAEMFGYSREELKQRTVMDLHKNVEDWEKTRLLLKESDFIEEMDVELVRKDGSVFWGCVTARPARRHGQNVFMAVLHDITEKKRIELKLEDDRELFQNAIESMSDGILVLDHDLRYTYWNRSMERISSVPRKQVINRDKLPWELFPHLAENGVKELMQQARDGRQCQIEGLPYRLENGNSGYTSETFIPLTDSNGAVKRVLGVVQDVTKRIQSEKQLRESETRFRAIFDNAAHSVVLLDTKGSFVLFNKRAHESLGYAYEEFAEKTAWNLIHPDDLPTVQEQFALMVTGQLNSHRMELRCLRKDGSIYWGDASTKVILDDKGQVQSLVAIIVDINEQKKAERELRESEELLSQALEISKAGVWTWNPQTDQIQLCYRLMKMLGYKRKELPDTLQGLKMIHHPDDWDSVCNRMTEYLQGRSPFYSHEYRLLRSDETWMWISARAKSVAWDSLRQPTRIIGTAIDITDKKLVEHNLRQSQQRFRLAAECASDLIYEWDIQSDRLEWYGGVDKALGYEPGELPRTLQAWLDLIHPEDRRRLHSVVEHHRLAHESFYTEYRIQTKDGRWLYWTDRGTPVFNDQNVPDRLIGVCTDITKRKQAEHDLRDSERLLRQVIDTTPVCIYVKDRQGRYVLSNEEDARLHGTTLQKMIGKTDLDFSQMAITHEMEARKFMADDMDVIDSKQPKFIAAENFSLPDGSKRVFQSVKVPLFLKNIGHCVLGVSVDITDQQQAQQDLIVSRQQLRNLAIRMNQAREENRTRIARELHDSIGQILAVLRMDLGRLAKTLSPNETAAREKISALTAAVDHSIDLIHTLCSELRPGLLDDFGLQAAIEQALEDFNTRTAIDCHFDCETDLENLDNNVASNLYRIVQEALTNIDRHAHASKVWIRLYRNKNDLMLEIKDNGKGITAEKINSSSSLGLIGMRERVFAMGGRFSIQGEAKQYTQLIICIPVSQWEDLP